MYQDSDFLFIFCQDQLGKLSAAQEELHDPLLHAKQWVVTGEVGAASGGTDDDVAEDWEDALSRTLSHTKLIFELVHGNDSAGDDVA
jgi:hypothetical protein